MPQAEPHPRKVFYGWWVVLASCIQLMVSSGIGFYGLAVYLSAVHDQRNLSVGAVSGAITLFFVVSGVFGIPVARLLQRRDPRFVLVPGSLVAGAGLIGIGRADSVVAVYAAFALFGAGFTATSIAITNTVITRWFHRRRSLALSLATSGLSLGGIACTPILKSFVTRTDGLDRYMHWVALIYILGVVVVPVALLRPDPKSMGLTPDGDAAAPGPARAADGVPLAAALRSPLYVALTAVFVLALCAQVGGLQHIVQLGKERDSAETATTLVSVLAFCSFAGRLIAGALLSRIPIRTYAAGALALQVAGLVALSVADGRLGLILSVALFGSSVGNVLLLHPLLLADEFGVRDYPTIYARSQFWVNLGVASGPFVVGGMHDLLHGYAYAYLVAAALSLGATLLFALRVRPLPRPIDELGVGGELGIVARLT